MSSKFGVQEGHVRLFDAQLRSHLGQVKIFPNDPKLLPHSDFVPNFLENHKANNLNKIQSLPSQFH